MTDRYPEDFTVLPINTLSNSALKHKAVIHEILNHVEDVLNKTPIVAHQRTLAAFELITKHHLWGKLSQTTTRNLRDIRKSHQLMNDHLGIDNPPGLRYPKLNNVTLSDRARCAQLEPNSVIFITDVYIAIRRFAILFSDILRTYTMNKFASYQCTSSVLRHVGETHPTNPVLHNPLLSEQFYQFLNSHKENYQRVVKLMRKYGSTPYLICLNTLQENVEYSKALNRELKLLDINKINEEWEILKHVHPGSCKAIINFSEFLTHQRHYLDTPFKLIKIPTDVPGANETLKTSDILRVAETVKALHSDILDACGNLRAYALLQTTHARWLNTKKRT